MEKLNHYGKIDVIESQTYEDPMILAMNIFEDTEGSYLFSQQSLQKL